MAATPNTPKKVTPEQLLTIREQEWRPRMASISLVSETELPPRHLEQAAQALGRLFTRALDTHTEPALQRWPACTAAVTAGIATEHYANGTFWPSLWRISGVPPARQERDQWGRGFLRSLEILGLETFPGQHFKYVHPILMHAGIPTYCLRDVFILLLERSAITPGLDAHGFHQWAIGGPTRLNSLDVPARKFISDGGDYSLETIERCMSLLELLREDPEADCRDVGLPPRFLGPARKALEAAASQGKLPERSRHRASSPRVARPKIQFDPYAHGVHVLLPTIDEEVRWIVTTDDTSHSVRGRPGWSLGTASAEQVRFPLPAPARTVRVAPHGTGVEERVHLIDPEDPLLVFTDEGERVSTALSLPPGPAWVLHPAERELCHEGASQAVEVEAPYGWEGWRARRFRLERAGWLALEDGPRHHVQGRPRPVLETGTPVAGVTTAYGSPVYPELPTIKLPEAEGAPVEWRVDVLAGESGRRLTTVTARSGERVDPLAELPRPAVGSFLISVRGPLGRGLRRQVTVAEGLRADHAPTPRLLTPGGLTPARTRLAVPDGVRAEPETLEFTAERSARSAQMTAGVTTVPVVVAPPHFAVLTTGEPTPQWRPRPLRLDTEAIADCGELLVRVPHRPNAPGVLRLLAGEQTVQRIEPVAHPGSPTVRYPLARASETVETHRHLWLVVDWDGQPLPVAEIRPRRLATTARYEEGTIILDGFPGIAEVSAAIYPHYAPWRPPVVLPVSLEGHVELPEELCPCGPAQVLLAIDDPWSITEWPRWPAPHTSNLLSCAAPGWPSGTDQGEALISQTLAEGGELSDLPPTAGNAIRLWRVLGLSTELRALGVGTGGLRACEAALGGFPATALLAHGDAGLSARESPRALILSGLVSAPQHQGISAVDAARLWHRLPATAAIASSELLPYIPPDTEDPHEWELLEELEHGCGGNATTLLNGETDPDASAGAFDANTEHLARMSAEQVDAMWRAAKVVPRAFLDADSRSHAARELFMARTSPKLHRARKAAGDIPETVLALCARLDTYRPVGKLITARYTRGAATWRNLPALSVALAITARLSARGMASFATLDQHWRPQWVDLAGVAPAMVALDLVLAELTLAGIERSYLCEETNQ